MRKVGALLLGIVLTLGAQASVESGIKAYDSGDYATAFTEFSTAAANGDLAGQHMLASLYYRGFGVERNPKKAIELFTKAADSGYLLSIDTLALIYRSGNNGVRKDIAKAMAWAHRGAAFGSLQSQFLLGEIYRQGDGVKQDYEQALRWYKIGAENGYMPSQNGYGSLFAQGHGVPLDYVKAYAWIDMPANAGNEDAIKNREQLLELMTPEQREQAEQLAKEYALKYPPRR